MHYTITQEQFSQDQRIQECGMQWEIATQNELFDYIKANPENKKTCQLAKALVLEEGMSNLGIEI